MMDPRAVFVELQVIPVQPSQAAVATVEFDQGEPPVALIFANCGQADNKAWRPVISSEIRPVHGFARRAVKRTNAENKSDRWVIF
jgi:hypothetical protein